MSSKTVACIVARTVSTRLPLKVLRNVVEDLSMLDFMIQRLKLVRNIDDIYLCTSNERVDDILEDVSKRNDVKIYRGSSDAVIERLIAVGELERAESIIRITGDNVFTSSEYLEEQIKIHDVNKLDYTRIIDVPIGASAEVMRLSAVKKCNKMIDASKSEYLLLYMYNPELFKCGVISLKGIKESSNYTVTVDTQDDYIRTKQIFGLFMGNPLDIKLKDIIDITDKHDIKNSKLEFSGNVKMPDDEEITFEEFQIDMNERKRASIHFTIG